MTVRGRRPSASPGVEVRHARACPARDGSDCACEPGYRAWVVNPRGRRKIQKTFRTIEEAVEWREGMRVDLRRGVVGASTSVTVAEAGEAWLAGVRAGAIRNRSGERYKPSAVRGYEQALRDYVVPTLGRRRLGELRRVDAQDFADALVAAGLGASTVRNALLPLRVICRRALVRRASAPGV